MDGDKSKPSMRILLIVQEREKKNFLICLFI